ncbi:MAG: twin-arginine translocation signal domain-containing protein, partial [Candidatus Hydrogenedentes bacterium]|nr:twin-arginine translocation signal domain-containing protein [Candidatus Hydrogenedentota bacterium]
MERAMAMISRREFVAASTAMAVSAAAAGQAGQQ